jgi:hypothetical protein
MRAWAGGWVAVPDTATTWPSRTVSLASDAGAELYRQRARSIEPTFGQIKHNRGFGQFRRRGRAAARSEWRLITATHNLLKLHQHWIAPATA